MADESPIYHAVQECSDRLEEINRRIYEARRVIESIDDGGPGKNRKMKGCISCDISEVEDKIEDILRQLRNFVASGDIDNED